MPETLGLVIIQIFDNTQISSSEIDIVLVLWSLQLAPKKSVLK
jgi:hypothetical protein